MYNRPLSACHNGRINMLFGSISKFGKKKSHELVYLGRQCMYMVKLKNGF